MGIKHLSHAPNECDYCNTHKQGDIVPSLNGSTIYVVYVGNITARVMNTTEREQPHIRATSVC